jgi:branched-chain amino acid transport system substrate-binding protein
MKKRVGIALAAAVAATATALVATTVASARADRSTAVNCKQPMKIALVTPLTGGAGFLGQEQLTWARLAVKRLAASFGFKITLLTGDTPVEQGPAPAQALAQKYVADPRVVGIIGPSTSGAVVASSPTYRNAGLVHISPSATRTSLTQGAEKEATPAFFRVVPGDYIQGPTDAKFMIERLKVKKVVIFDFQEPYSLGLADIVESSLKKAEVSTTRFSVPNTTTDYSAFVTRVPNDADVVFFPTQKPPDAQSIGKQLKEQGKKAIVFGGDGSNDPTQFNIPGSYISNFAPDITGNPKDKALIAAWQKDNKGKSVGSFGPPTYGAVEVLLNALKTVCNKDDGVIKNRRELISAVKYVKIANWILGGSFRFSTKTNDPLNATFYIFQIQQNGKLKQVFP